MLWAWQYSAHTSMYTYLNSRIVSALESADDSEHEFEADKLQIVKMRTGSDFLKST